MNELPADQTNHGGDPARELGEIVVLNRDLFFGVKIGNTLRALGYEVGFVRDTGAFVERLRGPDVPPVLGSRSTDLRGVVGAIPEPETYALMLGGLGIVGFVARRRRRM